MQVEEPRSFWLPVAGMAAGAICVAAICVPRLLPGRGDELWIGALIASLPIMVAGVVDWWWTRRHVRAILRNQIAADQGILDKEKHDLSARCAGLEKENHRLRAAESWLKKRDDRISTLEGQLGETESRLREKERKLETYRSGYARLSADPDSVVDLDQKMQELEGIIAARDRELENLRPLCDGATERINSEVRRSSDLESRRVDLENKLEAARKGREEDGKQLESALGQARVLEKQKNDLIGVIRTDAERLEQRTFAQVRRLMEVFRAGVRAMRQGQPPPEAVGPIETPSREDSEASQDSLADDVSAIERLDTSPSGRGEEPPGVEPLHRVCQQLPNQLEEATESVRVQVSELRTEHDQKVAALGEEKCALQTKFDEESERHKADLKRLEDGHSKAMKESEKDAETRIRQIEDAHKKLVAEMRQERETQLARLWPQAGWDQRVAEIRNALAEGLVADPPRRGARAFFGALHQLCVSFGDEGREPALAAEAGLAFYDWLHEFPPAQVQAWPETVVAWLNEHLGKCSLRAVQVGESFEPRWHSSSRQSGRIRRVDSFAVLNRDAAQTVWKKAKVEVE